jgi:hypothetical protein
MLCDVESCELLTELRLEADGKAPGMAGFAGICGLFTYWTYIASLGRTSLCGVGILLDDCPLPGVKARFLMPVCSTSSVGG